MRVMELSHDLVDPMQSGTLELRSGRWSWELARPEEMRTDAEIAGPRKAESETDEHAAVDPDPERDRPDLRLVLRDPDEPAARMSRQLATGARELTDEDVRSLAREPDERIVPTVEGESWLFRPVDRPGAAEEPTDDVERPPRNVRFSRRGEPQRVGRLPEGHPLDEATRDELMELLTDD